MDRPRVDPGALLLAVFAVGLGPLNTTGPWKPLNTVVSLIVLVVLLCYLRPHRAMAASHLFALCIVLGFIVSIALAWPVQRLKHGTIFTDQTEDDAIYLSLIIGVSAGVLSYVAIRRAFTRPSRTASATGSARLIGDGRWWRPDDR